MIPADASPGTHYIAVQTNTHDHNFNLSFVVTSSLPAGCTPPHAFPAGSGPAGSPIHITSAGFRGTWYAAYWDGACVLHPPYLDSQGRAVLLAGTGAQVPQYRGNAPWVPGCDGPVGTPMTCYIPKGLVSGTYYIWVEDGTPTHSGAHFLSFVVHEGTDLKGLITAISTSVGRSGGKPGSGIPSHPGPDLQARGAALHKSGFNAFTKILYRPLISDICATGVFARIAPRDIHGKTRPKLHAGTHNGISYDAGHLLGANLGGSNEDPENFTAQPPNTNRGSFQRAENAVRLLTSAGYGVVYAVEANYNDHPISKVGDLCIPSSFSIQIERTPIPIAPGQSDFYTQYHGVITIDGNEVPYDYGVMCGVSDIEFDNTTTSSAHMVIKPLIITPPPIPGVVDNRLRNQDCAIPVP